jgi:hypothetical protein
MPARPGLRRNPRSADSYLREMHFDTENARTRLSALRELCGLSPYEPIVG